MRKMTFRLARTVRLGGAVALLLGLCFTFGEATSASGASPSGKPLVLGVISTDSGAGETTTDTSTTVKDWSKYVNSHGGINGHPVKVVYDNDNDSAATAIQDATNLIQNQHVVAIGDSSLTGAAYASVADKAHVPVIGMVGVQSLAT